MKKQAAKKTSYLHKLDKLFDIWSCECVFIAHSNKCDVNCNKVHIDCKCGPGKLAPNELAFMKDQRDKVGPTGKYQLGQVVDKVYEGKRKRSESRRQRDKFQKKSDISYKYKT